MKREIKRAGRERGNVKDEGKQKHLKCLPRLLVVEKTNSLREEVKKTQGEL